MNAQRDAFAPDPHELVAAGSFDTTAAEDRLTERETERRDVLWASPEAWQSGQDDYERWLDRCGGAQ